MRSERSLNYWSLLHVSCGCDEFAAWPQLLERVVPLVLWGFGHLPKQEGQIVAAQVDRTGQSTNHLKTSRRELAVGPAGFERGFHDNIPRDRSLVLADPGQFIFASILAVGHQCQCGFVVRQVHTRSPSTQDRSWQAQFAEPSERCAGVISAERHGCCPHRKTSCGPKCHISHVCHSPDDDEIATRFRTGANIPAKCG